MMAMKRMSILAGQVSPERASTLPQEVRQYKEESEKVGSFIHIYYHCPDR